MTSPVERISGPNTASTPLPSVRRKRFHGKTASFTEIPLATPSPDNGNRPSVRSSEMVDPTEILAAALAKGTPVALLTKGTVREARGLASRTNSVFSAIAN